jgi:von Willebrand factor type A domain
VRRSRRLDRLTRPRAAVDSHDVAGLHGVIRRTGVIRLLLAGGALALVLVAAASARDPQTSESPLVPPDRIGVVVLDLSLSITDDDYATIRRTLRRLVAEDASIGLAVFSDAPYELLPPGTPSAELTPILRLLVAPRLGPVQNPWTQTFRAGTRISTALELAKSMLERDQVDAGSILLVSDLETAPDDVPALARTIATLKQADIRLRVVPLAPSSDALSLFQGLLEKDAVATFTSQAPEQGEPEAASTSMNTPVRFLVLGALVFLLLAAHERFSGRIALPRLRRAGGDPA